LNNTRIIFTHLERDNPKKIEKPKTKIFLDEFKSTDCKLESPTAVTVANTTENIPPIIGTGILTKTAPNFPTKENIIIRTPAA